MKSKALTIQPDNNPTNTSNPSLKVRTDLRAGAWNCANCQGQVSGNQLFKPTCEYCQQA